MPVEDNLHPDDLLECPYDKAHMIRAKRMQSHLQACRKHHASGAEVTCPFNASHVINEEERRYHLTRCPDRHQVHSRVVDEMLQKTDNRGCVETPAYLPIALFGETWEKQDKEANQQSNHHAGRPSHRLEVKIQEEEFEGYLFRQNTSCCGTIKANRLVKEVTDLEVTKKGDMKVLLLVSWSTTQNSNTGLKISFVEMPTVVESDIRNLLNARQRKQLYLQRKAELEEASRKQAQSVSVPSLRMPDHAASDSRSLALFQQQSEKKNPSQPVVPGDIYQGALKGPQDGGVALGRGQVMQRVNAPAPLSGRGRGRGQQNSTAAAAPTTQFGLGQSNVPMLGNGGVMNTHFSELAGRQDGKAAGRGRGSGRVSIMQEGVAEEKKDLYGRQGIGYDFGIPFSASGIAEGLGTGGYPAATAQAKGVEVSRESCDSEDPERFVNSTWVGDGYGEGDQTGPIPSFSDLSLGSYSGGVGSWADQIEQHAEGGYVAGAVSPRTESIATSTDDQHQVNFPLARKQQKKVKWRLP